MVGTVEMLNIRNIGRKVLQRSIFDNLPSRKCHLTKDQQVAELKFSFEVLRGGRYTTSEQNTQMFHSDDRWLKTKFMCLFRGALM